MLVEPQAEMVQSAAIAFSSEADTDSHQENASKQEAGAPLRFYRNGNGSEPTGEWPPRERQVV